MKNSRGFTLLEIIVVIAIFGVMAAMAYGGLASVLNSRVRVDQALDRTAQLQKAYMRMRDDFQQVRNRPVRDNFGDPKPAFYGSRDNQVWFTHGGWRNPLGLPRASLERVFYRLDEKNGALVRGSYRVLDQAPDSKPAEVDLLSGVDDLKLRYLDPATREWIATWPRDTLTDNPAALAALAPPLAVELTLDTKDLGKLRFLFKLGLDPQSQGSAAGLGIPAPPGGVASPGNGTGTGIGNPVATPPPANGVP